MEEEEGEEIGRRVDTAVEQTGIREGVDTHEGDTGRREGRMDPGVDTHEIGGLVLVVVVVGRREEEEDGRESRDSWEGGRDELWLDDEEEWPRLGGPGGSAILLGLAPGSDPGGRGVRGTDSEDRFLEVESSCSDTFLRAEAEDRVSSCSDTVV